MALHVWPATGATGRRAVAPRKRDAGGGAVAVLAVLVALAWVVGLAGTVAWLA